MTQSTAVLFAHLGNWLLAWRENPLLEPQQLLERIWLEQKFTAVLVTHDVAEAVALADRVVVIDEGRIALDLDISVARPRRRGSVELARLEGRILDQLFG